MPASPKLSASQAKAIANAEARVAEANRALADAKAERDRVRTRYADRVPVGELIRAGGLTIKRRVQASGQSFRLTAFLERHKLTAAMRPFVTKGSPFEVWDVRPDVIGRSGRRTRSAAKARDRAGAAA